MEVLFENIHIRDRETLKEIYRYSILRRPLMIAMDIIMALIVLFGILSVILFGDFNYQLLLCIIAYILIRILPYYSSVRITLKRDAESSRDTPIRVITTVTDESVMLSDGCVQVNEYPLSVVHYAVYTKSCILLRTKAKQLLILKKNGFTKGSWGEFVVFLKNKGIPIK